MQEPQELQVRSLGQEDPLEEGMAFQYSFLENPMDRGAWQALVHGVAKSRTRLKRHRAADASLIADGINRLRPNQ